MVEELEYSVLVSNIVSEIRYSNCRLCLKVIVDSSYVSFEDSVSFGQDEPSTSFQPLSAILTQLLGAEICEEIIGVDAVCLECVNKALETSKFLQKCVNSTKVLHNIFKNLLNTLSEDINVNDNFENQSLYITVDENDTKLIFVGNEEAKNNATRKQKRASFPCIECPNNFDNIIDLKMHNLTEHAMLTCEKCLDSFQNDDELSAHESSETMYTCPSCNIYRCTKDSLKTHQDKQHRVYVCKDCGKSFQGIDKLQSHELKHVTKSECPKCGKSYNTKEFFLKHVRLCVEDRLDPHPIRSKMEKKYSCNKCGKGYSTPGGLRVHNRFIHGNAKPHTCKYCQKQFTAPSYLKIHMVKHTGEKNFKCALCMKNFVTKEALLYHTRRHTGEKPYSCTMCDERFVNASARAEHIKFKHVGPTLMCEICSRKFVTPNFLRQHIKKHHDPTNKLYMGRSIVPANIPAIENIRMPFYNENNEIKKNV